HTTLPRGPTSSFGRLDCGRPPHRETEKSLVQSRSALSLYRFRYPAISLQSAEVTVWKGHSKSIAYEFRTRSVQSGGLETNRPRERISGLGGCAAVRRFSREPRGYWTFMRARSR